MNLILVEKLKNGEVTQTLLSKAQALQVNPDASYYVFDPATMKAPEGLILKRKGAALEVEVEQEVAGRIEGFYDEGSHAVFSVDGSEVINASESSVAAAGETVEGIVWQPSAFSTLVVAGGALGIGSILALTNNSDGDDGVAADSTPPTISAVSIPDSEMKVGDVVTVTLTVADDGGDTYTNVSGTVGGFALSNLTRIDSTTYSAQFTVTEGGIDVAADADIPVSIIIDDSAGNTSAAFTASISQAGDAIDANSPSISAISIPNATMNVGDVVIVTLTVSDDGGNPYTNLSGTVGGFTLSNLTRINSATYTTQFTVIEGGTDVAADADIPVSITLDDSAGNTSATFTTPISQPGDEIIANTPLISAASIPDAAMNVGDVVTVTLTVVDDGGDPYTNLSGTVGGFALSNLSRTNSTTYTAQFTVTEGGSDVAASADIPVSITLDDSAGDTSAIFSTPISQAGDAIDANSPSISAVSIANAPMNVGDVVTVSITASEAGLSLSSGTVNGVGVTGFTDNGGGSYSAIYTVAEGNTDRAAGDDIPVSFALQDSAGNPSAIFTTPISQAGDAIDANSPIISAVSIPNAPMNVGDVVIVTLTVVDDLSDTYTNVSGTVGGFALSNLTRTNSTTYTAQFTVTEGGTDVPAGADIPVSVTLDDSAGNTSATFTTPISQAGDAIDANSSSISAVSIPNAPMNVGDVVTVTLTVSGDGGDPYTNVSGTVGGFSLSNLTRTNSTTYTAQFTVTEGGTDVAAGADIPVAVTIDDSAGNTSATFTTPISQAGDAIDANSPSISAVSIANAPMNVGDVVTVTITANEAGLILSSGSVNGVGVTGFTDNGGGSYSAIYTVAEGNTDRAAGDDIPVSFALQDGAGNPSATFTTPISQAGDAIDANSPTLTTSSPSDEATGVALDANIVLNFNENIALGSGNIVISDGTDTITIDVASHGGQLSVSGSQLTINPTADLANNSTNYNVQVAPTAIVDTTGNSYAGITDSETLDFTTTVDTNVVVFDLTAGTSSDHSSRTFSGGVTYNIYIVAPSNSEAISMSSPWSGASTLGSDDTIHLVGSGSAIIGFAGVTLTGQTNFAGSIAWNPSVAFMGASGAFTRSYSGALGFVDIYATGAHATNVLLGAAATALPTSIAATQVLS